MRTALAGAGRFGADVLDALRATPEAELVGLSDRNAAVAEAAAAEAGCPGYADHRRLLAETNPHVVFLTVPPVPGAEVVRLAARHGVHLWQEPPVGRDLAEAVQLCRLMDQTNLKYAVGAQRRFMPGYRRARRRVGELGRAYLVEARYLFNFGGPLEWRGDREAGGGVLRTLAHHVFDLVGWMLGVPETVYCIAAAGQRAGADQPVYDTEDTAVIVANYPDRATVNIVVSRCFNPVSEGLALYAENGSLQAGPAQCTVRDRDGTVQEHFTEDRPPGAVVREMIEDFLSVVAGGGDRYECSAGEGLLAAAMAEASALSDRTRQAESPVRLLAGFDLTVDQCLRRSRAVETAP